MVKENKKHHQQKRLNIGLFVNYLNDEYSRMLWNGVTEMAKQLDVNVILFQCGNIKYDSSDFYYHYQESLSCNLASSRFLDGLIISDTVYNFSTMEEINHFLEPFRDIPLVSIAMELPQIHSVMVNNSFGIKQIIHHLAKIHHRKRIAFIKGPEANPDAESRYQSFLQGMKESGLTVYPELILNGLFIKPSGKEAVKELLDVRKQECDAIVAANDNMAIGAMRELNRRKIKVPEEIAVTGFDNLHDCMYTAPPLTTIMQPVYMQGIKALETLIDLIKGKELPYAIYLDTQVIYRNSCGCKKSEIVTPLVELKSDQIEEEIRAKISSVLEQYMVVGPRVAIGYEFILEILQAFRSYTDEKESQIIQKLEKCVQYYEAIGIGFNFWHSIFDLFTKYYSKLTGAQELIDKMLSWLKVYEFNNSRLETNERDTLAELLRFFVIDTISSYSEEELFSILDKSLPGIGINSFALNIFDTPIVHKCHDPWEIPEKVNRLYILDQKVRIQPKPDPSVSSKDFLPETFLNAPTGNNYYIHSLFHRENCYGFMVILLEPGLRNRYEYMAGTLSNFYRIMNLNKQKEAAQIQILKRNLEMENDILMARKIQNQLIPEKSPRESIAFIYKPMDQVGGDFVDFLEFREQNSIGIFVSDVSGHGVPAAFITSMIKSAITLARDQQDNPASLLQSLNKSLFHQTGGNFVTAFYGIFKLESRKFIYANAGHNLPYLIQGNRLKLLESHNRSIPLGVMDNQEMLEVNRSYINYTIQLAPESKLVLYTDGLTEAVPGNPMKPDFETEKLEHAFLKNSSKPAKAFVDEVYRLLVDYHGSDNFTDDVCIICLDVI